MSDIKLLSDFSSEIENCRSTSDRVSDVLRHAIISRTLAQGERLVEAKVAKELNVSITPVRHAFVDLESEGLLDIYPFKGTYVTTISSKLANDVIYVRICLETAAAKLAFPHLTQKDTEQLRNYCKSSDKYFFEEKNLYESIRCDMLFHSVFFEKGDNDPLLKMWSMLKSRIELIISHAKPDTLTYGHAMNRHEAIIRAIEIGNAQEFIDSLAHHLRTSVTFANF